MLVIPKTPFTNSLNLFHTQHFLKQKNASVSLKNSSNTFIPSSYKTASTTTIRALNPSIGDPNIKIRKFCDMGNLEKAMNLITQLERSNLEVETYCSVLELCVKLKCLNSGRRVHLIIEASGVEIDSVVGSKLVFMYVRCGDLREGRRVFDRIANEKVFLWNLLINEYAVKGFYNEGISLYVKMQFFGVRPNSHTFTSVLKCFSAQKSVFGGEVIHGYLLKLMFSNADVAVVNSLIAFYFKRGSTMSASKVFDEMSERDVITWNSMISGYVANGFAAKGLRIFIQMLNLGIAVDLVTILNVLAACASIGFLLSGIAVHAYSIKAGFGKDETFNNTLLDMYSKCDDIESATQVFQTMSGRSVVTWTSMISGYTQHGLLAKTTLLFDEMKKERVKLDYFIVTSVLHACACSGSLEKGKEVHSYIEDNRMHLNLSVCNALMDMYAKCGSMAEAESIFSQMPIKDIVSWNTMIGGYSKNNFPNHALSLFNEMQRKLKPDSITMACILPACASLGALDRGREIHCHILKNGILGIIYVDNALIDMYAKCGALYLAQSLFKIIPRKDFVSWTVMIAGYAINSKGEEAISTFKDMRKSGIELDEVSFVSILSACSHSRLAEVGWRFFNIMRNNCKTGPNLDHYACMVDILAKSGKLLLAYEFIDKMPIKPGVSIWGALLYGCKIHHDVKLAEKVADRVFELEPNSTEYYLILADIYAEAQKREKEKRRRRLFSAA